MIKEIVKDKLIVIKVCGNLYIAKYIGRQEGFECIICGKGKECHTFNIYESKANYYNDDYETWGFGQEHLPKFIQTL